MLPLITYHNYISLEINLPSKHTVKTRTFYNDIKSIYFELLSNNIRTFFHNIIHNINSLKIYLKLNL